MTLQVNEKYKVKLAKLQDFLETTRRLQDVQNDSLRRKNAELREKLEQSAAVVREFRG